MDSELKKFLSNFSEIELMSRQIKNSTSKEYEAIAKDHQLSIKNGVERQSFSHHNMFFHSLPIGKTIFYDHTSRDFNQRKKDLLNRKNRSYLWLFAEAFEHFEDLIEILYAHLGHTDSNAWPSKDKKGEAESSLATKPFEWYLQQSKLNKKLHTKLECIRKKYPILIKVEKSNNFGIDLKFTIAQIEIMRHVIVHNGGKIKNIGDFIQKIFTQSGMDNNGCHDPEKLQQIQNFITQDACGYRITMLDIQESDTPFHISRFDTIINWLLAYSEFIYKIITKK
jgi:hypothetical protein